VDLPGGKLKIVYFEKENKVKLIGDSKFIFEGKIDI
jgi:diaminopimelate epimerase